MIRLTYIFVMSKQVKIWFQNRRSKYKKMLKANQVPGQGGGNAQAGGQSGPPQTPTGASTPQSPPETPENPSPPSVGPPPPLMPVGPSTPASSASMPTQSPPAMSPPITSWDMGMGNAKANVAMSNSYIPQYSWYHHGHHDPSMNSQLLT